MEAFLILGLLASLAVLAVRFGHDSRDRFSSHEERLSAHGFAWGMQAESDGAIGEPRRFAGVNNS
jgi:hypothetical protein